MKALRRKKNVERLLDKAVEVFEQEIAALASRVREDIVVPFCDQHGVEFKAGNGTWVFVKDGQILCSSPVMHLNEMKGPRGFSFVSRVLDLDIPVWDRGMPSYMGGLGAFIEDYSPVKTNEVLQCPKK
jgi:hypothetical protein